MAGVRGEAVLQAGARAADPDPEPADLLLWQSTALASTAEAPRLPLQRLYQVSAEKTTKSVWCIVLLKMYKLSDE